MRTTMARFVDIPVEVLHRSFFPKLDYNTRVALNACLPLELRFVKRFSKHALEAHDLEVNYDMFLTRSGQLYGQFDPYLYRQGADLGKRQRWLKKRVTATEQLLHNKLYQRAGGDFRRFIHVDIEGFKLLLDWVEEMHLFTSPETPEMPDPLIVALDEARIAMTRIDLELKQLTPEADMLPACITID